MASSTPVSMTSPVRRPRVRIIDKSRLTDTVSCESLRLQLVELGLADRSRVEKLFGRRDLIGARAATARGGDRPHILILLSPHLLLLGHGALRHAPAAGDEVDQDPEERHEDDKQAPDSLRPPAHVVATEDVREDIEHAHDPCEEDEELEQCEQERPVVVEHLTASSVGLMLKRRPWSDLRKSLA